MRPNLRLFTGEDTADEPPQPTVSIPLSDLTRVLRHAVRFDRTWLDDFEGEDVQISEDLYDVLHAYWSLRPGA